MSEASILERTHSWYVDRCEKSTEKLATSDVLLLNPTYTGAAEVARALGIFSRRKRPGESSTYASHTRGSWSKLP